MRFSGCCTIFLIDERKFDERPRCIGGSTRDGGARGFRSSYAGGKVRKEESITDWFAFERQREMVEQRKDKSV